jgi:hypothetical protein
MVVQDDFNGSLLSSDWEWYLPAVGPTYSLSSVPGYLQVAVPPGYDHWLGSDTSPQVRRSDMGDGDWAIETHIDLDPANTGD